MSILVIGCNTPHCSCLATGLTGKTTKSTNKRLAFLLLLLLCTPAAFAASGPDVLTAKAKPRAGKAAVEFFTFVKPVHDVAVLSATTGRLEDFHVKPGNHVASGEQLGRLGGAAYTAALASAQATVRMTERALLLAQDQLGVDKARYPLLIDRGGLDQGKLKVARERDEAIRARAMLSALQSHGIITSPTSGSIVHVASGNGEHVMPGEKLLTIQPSEGLWLVGSIFGRDIGRVRIGMHGKFHPDDGGAAISVRVNRIFPRSAGDGVGIGLLATSAAPGWFSGEGGMVKLYAATGNEPAVPDSALVLDKGRWWVIKNTDGHMEPVQVVPDGSGNGWTWIGAGLKTGTSVVISNAYLIFHKSFAKKYSGD